MERFRTVVFFHMTDTRHEIIKEFMQICGSTKSQAMTYLDATNYSLARAVDEYLAHSTSPSCSASAAPKRSKLLSVESPSYQLSSFFESYKSSVERDVIDPEGIERLSLDLGIETLDPVWLYIADKCHSKTMGYFSKKEWLVGMRDMGVNGVDGLKNSIDTIRDSLRSDASSFKDVYSFSFRYTLDEGARNLSLFSATQLWDILLPLSDWELTPKWLNFLRREAVIEKFRAVTKDTWNLVLSFRIKYPNMESILQMEESEAWPLMIDEFITELQHIDKTTKTDT